MINDSTQIRRGRYVSGGITEVNAKALEWWERARYTHDVSDTKFTIDHRYAGRIDLVAHATLQDDSLGWLILQYNAILDPFNEIVPGRVLRIPTKTRVQTMLSGKIGGVPSTRKVPLSNVTPIV